MKNLITIGNIMLGLFITVVITISYTENHPKIIYLTETIVKEKIVYKEPLKKVNYWATVWNIESHMGKNLIQKKDKKKGTTSCEWTKNYCGHFQLGYKALKDIQCVSRKCFSNRFIYKEALIQAKDFENILKHKYKCNLGELQYLCHQQGATGAKNIVKASKGKKVLSNAQLKRMARNSKYSYGFLKKKGSKRASELFLTYWKNKWYEKAIYYPSIAEL